MQGDVGAPGVLVSGLLVAVAILLSWRQGLQVEASIAWAAVRALAQLLLIGAALGLIIDPDTPIVWSWVWVVLMVAFAGVTVQRRAREVPSILGIALAAFAAASVVTLGVLFGLGVFPVEGRTVVPLAGMMVGNSMTATVLVGRRIVDELRDKRPEVEVLLALGWPAGAAARRYVAGAVRTALIPQIETTKAVGIVFLPGAMTGLILAGVDPVDAVLVQIVVMYLVLGSVATTTAVVGLGLSRRLFTSDHRLVPLARPAEPGASPHLPQRRRGG